MSVRARLKRLLPDAVPRAYRRLKRFVGLSDARFVYAPMGWDTVLPASERGYESPEAVAREREDWVAFMQSLPGNVHSLVTPHNGASSPWARACDHNVFMTYGYVVALAAQRRGALKILDYGGSLGGFYQVARALVPEIPIEYHCRDLPEMARVGNALNPEITWHTDDGCFAGQYDLVMFSGSLQYVRDWKETLGKASQSTRGYLYLTALPVVERAQTYVAVQSHAGSMMLHQQFNKDELLGVLGAGGLRLTREFWLEDHPQVVDAPEQPTFYGCLLKSGASG